MKDESKDPDTIDGAVRVAQLVNRKPWVLLSFLSFLSICWKCSFCVSFFRLAIILISSCIMFRTWLTLPDQSGHHRLELLVSHLTFTLIYNCTLTTSLLQAIWSNVSQYQFASLWFALIYYANHYCSLVPRDVERLPRDEERVQFCVSSEIRWNSILLFVLL